MLLACILYFHFHPFPFNCLLLLNANNFQLVVVTFSLEITQTSISILLYCSFPFLKPDFALLFPCHSKSIRMFVPSEFIEQTSIIYSLSLQPGKKQFYAFSLIIVLNRGEKQKIGSLDQVLFLYPFLLLHWRTSNE